MSSQKPNAAQIRSALALLKWENKDLAKACKITAQSVSNIKNGSTQAQPRILETMFKVFDENGVEFTDNSGVRFKSRDIMEHKGTDGFKRFMDDVYTAACEPSASDGSKPICTSNVDSRLFKKHLGDYMQLHIQRMNELKKVKVKILAKEQDFYEILSSDYIEYRWEEKHQADNVPFYVYGDKLAILTLGDAQKLEIVVISSAMVAKAYRAQFEALWRMAKPAPKKSA